MYASGEPRCVSKAFATNLIGADAPSVVDAMAGALVSPIAQPPPLWTILIGPTVVVVSVAISATLALLSIYSARAIARQRATLDLIEKRESTAHYVAIHRRFAALRRGRGFVHLDAADAEDEDRRAVVDYLNHYELVAIGIRKRVLDERFYREWMRGPFVRDWNAAADFVQQERWKLDATGGWKYHPTIYANYEAVACRWSPDARRLDRAAGGPPAAAAGPTDDAYPRSGDEVDTNDGSVEGRNALGRYAATPPNWSRASRA